jgi:N utilization substance protein B
MSERHKSREHALQMLFQWEIGKQQPSRIEEGFWKIARAEKTTRGFANELFEGAVSGAAELDALVAGHAEHWRLERMSVIDRAILRLAAFELHSPQTPAKVVLNEALELTKKFSSAEAVPFVNGVLDALLRTMRKKEKEKEKD